MTQARRNLLACLPLALTPAASRAIVLEDQVARATASGCVVGCAEDAVHETLQAALEDRVDGRPVPASLAVLARCPFCGRGFGGPEVERAPL